ncbi:hypothetical protein DRP04_05695 [Archaeoglobales archaeon]|nr:MAG: hypothetical protein DRP04_05695 [Archaeoglobales archaeon]
MGRTATKKLANYLVLVDYTLLDKLTKFSALQAYIHGRRKVEAEDVERAFVDLFEFIVHEFDYITHKVEGFLDYGEKWAGARKEDQICLRWLYEQGATSPEASTVSIDEFIQKIAEICQLTRRGARERYRKFKERGWIDSKQISRNETRVWLSFLPEIVKMERREETVAEIVSTYHELVFKINSLQEAMSPLSPMTPLSDDEVSQEELIRAIKEALPAAIEKWEKEQRQNGVSRRQIKYNILSEVLRRYPSLNSDKVLLYIEKLREKGEINFF